MSGRVTKMPQPNPAIKCAVNACHYHGAGDRCYAQEIEVQSPDAKTSQMTDCTTFFPG